LKIKNLHLYRPFKKLFRLLKEQRRTETDLMEKKKNTYYNRHLDAFKTLLLALKIYYPSKFRQIEDSNGIELIALFDLDNISGRDIKYRNICLFNLSEYYKRIQKD